MPNDQVKLQHLISSLAERPTVKILFVCLGNICRSPAAEGVLRSIVKSRGTADRYVIDSAGTQGYHAGSGPDPRMLTHARRRGLELDHICRRVTESDFDDFDLIIGMDASNLAALRRIAPTPEAAAKVYGMADLLTGVYARWDHVPDPYYDGAEGFELVLDLLENGCANLADAIDNPAKS